MNFEAGAGEKDKLNLAAKLRGFLSELAEASKVVFLDLTLPRQRVSTPEQIVTEESRGLADPLFSSTSSELSPLNQEKITQVVEALIKITQEFAKGANVYKDIGLGTYADGWLYLLKDAKDVLENNRKSPQALHQVFSQLVSLRLQTAQRNLVNAGKSYKSFEGTLHHLTDPDGDKLRAASALELSNNKTRL
jgi:hypothetical protein